jgi:hypothetical protein
MCYLNPKTFSEPTRTPSAVTANTANDAVAVLLVNGHGSYCVVLRLDVAARVCPQRCPG